MIGHDFYTHDPSFSENYSFANWTDMKYAKKNRVPSKGTVGEGGASAHPRFCPDTW
jgi:hypothetical protein